MGKWEITGFPDGDTHEDRTMEVCFRLDPAGLMILEPGIELME